MNREFEILNRKLEVLFEELMWLRRYFQRERYDRERKALKYEVENSQDKLKRFEEEQRYIYEREEDVLRKFHNIDNLFLNNGTACEVTEKMD